MKRYLPSLDYLRAIAAINVCFLHFVERPHFLSKSNPLTLLFSHGYLGVPIFFILSGFVLPYSMRNNQYSIDQFFTFLKKRIIRIDPPYLVCLLLVLLLNYLTTVTPGYVGPGYTFDTLRILYHVGYLPALVGKEWLNPVFWTLGIEFQFYLLIALIYPLINHRSTVVWLGILVLLNLFSIHTSFHTVFYHFHYFTLGIIVYRFFTEKNPWCLAGVILVLLLIGYRYTYWEVTTSLFTCIFICLPLKSSYVSTFFSNISYSMYLLHFPIGVRIINIANRFNLTPSGKILIVLASFGIVCIGSYFFFTAIEKPFLLLSKRIRYIPKKEPQVEAL